MTACFEWVSSEFETFGDGGESNTPMTAETTAKEGKRPETEQIAPEFQLPDSSGALRSLADLAAAGPLVLLFYRGHW